MSIKDEGIIAVVVNAVYLFPYCSFINTHTDKFTYTFTDQTHEIIQ